MQHFASEPISLSWSQLRTAEECRQKLHLVREGHRSSANNIRNFYQGMVVDRVMGMWLANPQRQPGQMPTLVTDAIDTGEQEAIATGDGVVRWRHLDDKADVARFCTELVTRLEPILYEHVLPHPFQVSTRFKVAVKLPHPDGTPTLVYLIGETDLLVSTPAGTVVWDLKGTKDNTYWRKVLGQLVFYDLAILAGTGHPTAMTGLIQPMCDLQVMPVHISDDDRRQMWARILRLATTIWTQDRTCKASTAGCEWCDVNHACPRYNPSSPLAASLLRAARSAL